MDYKRPLIYFSPLSPSAEKLKSLTREILSKKDPTQEEIDDGAEVEDKNFEIYEVVEGEEINQLLPTIGPSLTVVSSPKKCAMLLKSNSKYIKKFQSKVLLLSVSEIPSDVMNKLMKLGLTEHMAEPVNPKTLLFKIKFLLKSLKSLQKEEEKEKTQAVVFKKSDDEKKKEENTSEVLRVEKGILTEKSASEINLDSGIKGEKKVDLGLEEPVPELLQKSSLDNMLPADNKPSISKKSSDLLPDKASPIKDKSNLNLFGEENKDNFLEKYYKGKNSDDLKLDMEAKAKQTEVVADDDLFLRKSDVNIVAAQKELDELNAQELERVADDELDLGLVAASKKRGGGENLDLDLAAGKKSKQDKMEELDLLSKAAHPESLKGETDESLGLKKIAEVNLLGDDFSEDDAIRNAKQELLNLDLTPGKKHSADRPTDLDDLVESSVEKKQNEAVIEIDLSRAKKLKQELSDDEEKARLKLKEQEVELSLDPTGTKPSAEISELDLCLKKAGLLDLVDAQESQEDDLQKRAKAGEMIIDLQAARERKDAQEVLDIDDGVMAADKIEINTEGLRQDKNNLKLDLNSDLEIESGSKKNKEQSLELDLFGDKKLARKNKKDEDVELDLDSSGKIKNHGVEHISTYYGLKKKEGLEKGADWDILKEDNVLNVEKRKRKKGGGWEGEESDSSAMAGQAIDYRKMKQEFALVGQILAKGKADVGTNKWTYVSLEDPEVQEMVAKLHALQDDPAKMIKELELEEEDEAPVIEPKSEGLEFIIKTYLQYTQPKLDVKNIFKDIARIIWKEHEGVTTFLVNEFTKDKYFEEYVGYLELDVPMDQEECLETWNKLKEVRTNLWRITKLPTWSDDTFQSPSNEFVYPYFEGDGNMGVAIVGFNKPFEQKYAKTIEIILESARGIFLNKFHEQGGAGAYLGMIRKDYAQDENGEGEKLWNKLFGKKA